MATRKAQLAKRVEAWQRRLGPLGLAYYTIDGITVTDAPNGNPNAAASVTPSRCYDRAAFEFRTDIVAHAYDEGDFEYLDQTILHEWLHVAFQGFENSIEMVEDKLSDPQLDLWHEVLDMHREQLIDRLSRQLYAAFKSNVVP